MTAATIEHTTGPAGDLYLASCIKCNRTLGASASAIAAVHHVMRHNRTMHAPELVQELTLVAPYAVTR